MTPQELAQMRERLERLEAQQHVTRAVLDKVLVRLESLARDLGLAQDLAELRELRRGVTPATPATGLSRKTALELGEKLERLEGAARSAHASVRGLRKIGTSSGETGGGSR